MEDTSIAQNFLSTDHDKLTIAATEERDTPGRPDMGPRMLLMVAGRHGLWPACSGSADADRAPAVKGREMPEKIGKLSLTRSAGERVRLRTKDGEVAWVKVAEVSGGKVRLEIEANVSIEILREELLTWDD